MSPGGTVTVTVTVTVTEEEEEEVYLALGVRWLCPGSKTSRREGSWGMTRTGTTHTPAATTP